MSNSKPISNLLSTFEEYNGQKMTITTYYFAENAAIAYVILYPKRKTFSSYAVSANKQIKRRPLADAVFNALDNTKLFKSDEELNEFVKNIMPHMVNVLIK